MSMLNWSSDYSVGVDDLDIAHSLIVDLINKMGEILISDPVAQDQETFKDLVKEFIKDSAEHYVLEEIVLANIGYVGLAEHAAAHRDLMNKCLLLQKRLEAGEAGLGIEILNFFLNVVFLSHVCHMDALYAPELREYYEKANRDMVEEDLKRVSFNKDSSPFVP